MTGGIEHGTYAGSQKCPAPRCEPCKRAGREYVAAWRAKRRTGRLVMPVKTPYRRSGLGWPGEAALPAETRRVDAA
jgi:hypothetical protein